MVALLLLTGCTGDRAAADFEASFRDDPAVASLELTSHDNQPFTGGVSGDLHAVAGLSDDDLIALVDRVSAYTVEYAESMRGHITVISDAVTLVVRGPQTADASRAAFALGVLAEPGVASVELGGADRDTLTARVADVDDAFALVGRLPDMAVAHGLAAAPAFHLRTPDATTDLAGAGGDTLGSAREVWTTLSQALSLSGVRVGDDVITITLADEADAAAAAAIAAGMDDTIRFASPTVRLGVDGDGALARGFLAAVSADVRAQIAHVWESAGTLRVAAVAADRVPALLWEIARTTPIDPALVTVGADGEQAVDVIIPAHDLDTYAAAVGDLLARPGLLELRVRADDVSITVAELNDADLAAFAAGLKLIAEDGARVCVHRPADAVCVTAAREIDPGEVRDEGAAFVDAWNLAPAAP